MKFLRAYRLFLYFLVIGLNVHMASASTSDSTFKISVDNELLTAPEVLSIYIQKKSPSCQEITAGEWLKGVCSENGLFIYEYGIENGNYNFAATLLPLSDSLPNVILLNHIDVVDEGDSTDWIHPPYSGFISEEDVWGRGAFDNKGPAIMQLFSLLEFKSKHQIKKLTHNISFLAVSCEETMCDGGATYVLENHLNELNPVAVIGEGSTELGSLIDSKQDKLIFGVSLAHKRPLWLELELNIPTSGHGSVTPLEYANKEMTIALSNLVQQKTPLIFIKENKEILKILAKEKTGLPRFILNHPKLFKSIISKKLREEPEIFALFTNTVTVTSINSNNSTVNVIPNSVHVILDCRLLPEFPQEKMIEFVSNSLDNELIEISIIETTDPTPISKSNTPYYRYLESAIRKSYKGVNVHPIILPNFSDVGKFRSFGIQGYSIIPIQLDIEYLKCIHGPNERIPIESLQKGTGVYLTFLKNVQTLN